MGDSSLYAILQEAKQFVEIGAPLEAREVPATKKGNDYMPHEGEQSQLRRRRVTTTGEQTSIELGYAYPKAARKSAGPSTDYPGYQRNVNNPDAQNTAVTRVHAPSSLSPARIGNAALSTTQQQALRRSKDVRNPTAIRQPRTTVTVEDPPSPRKPRDSFNPSSSSRRVHWMLPLGVGMVAMLALWLAGSSVLAFGLRFYNDWHYGTPRTYQVDAVVGHNNDSPEKPSHFMAMNLNRQAVVVELMAGDPAKSVSYVAPVTIAGEGGELAPVTLEFRDVNHDDKKDMIITIHLDQQQVLVFINDGSKFRPPAANDNIQI